MKKQLYKLLIIIGIVIITLEISGVIFIFVHNFIKDYYLTKNNLKFYQKIADNSQTLIKQKIEENLALKQEMLQKETEFSRVFSELNNLKDAVNALVKLRNLDPELLKKYSKIYFLNENYTPKNLIQIDPQYVSNSQDQYILSNVLPFLYTLLSDAKKDNIDLKIKWAYRSFWEQYNIKTKDMITYGTGANKFVADQGYSEHQLGTTVDFVTKEFNGNASLFYKTKAYQWLVANAYKYGFVLSYPKNNRYYIYEPWHWRFVGIKLATYLHNQNKYLYDLDQREIDQYLLYIFDW